MAIYTQKNSAEFSNGQHTATLGFLSNVTAGNTIIVVSVGNGSVIASVSDNVNGAYTLCTNTRATSSVSSDIAIWYRANTGAGATTVSVTNTSGNNYISMVIAEYPGLLTALPFDVGHAATGSTTAHNSGATATLAQAAELVIGGTLHDSGPVSVPTAGAGFALVDYQNSTSNVPVAMEEKTVSATTAQTATFTWEAAFATAVATFKQTGGAVDPFPLLPGHGISPLYRM